MIRGCFKCSVYVVNPPFSCSCGEKFSIKLISFHISYLLYLLNGMHEIVLQSFYIFLFVLDLYFLLNDIWLVVKYLILVKALMTKHVSTVNNPSIRMEEVK